MGLEKAFDRVLREVIGWAMHKLGVEEWLVSAVMSMYTRAKAVVRTACGNSNGFEVKIGMHQGSDQTDFVGIKDCACASPKLYFASMCLDIPQMGFGCILLSGFLTTC